MISALAQQSIDTLIVSGIGAVLGGGLLVGLSQLISARSQARTARLQETGTIAASSLGGAEQAIALMERALARASDEIEKIKRDRDLEIERSQRKDQRIQELEDQLNALKSRLGTLSSNVDQTIRQVQEAKQDKDETP